MTDRGSVSTDNPFEQVRNYMFNVVDTLKHDPLLVNEGGGFKGKPVLSFGHGVAFANITRKQFEQTDLHEVFPPERCIFRDEMAEKVDAEAFRERVWRMVSPRIGPALSLGVLMSDTNPMPYEEACDREVEVGIDLRSAGFGVWQA